MAKVLLGLLMNTMGLMKKMKKVQVMVKIEMISVLVMK
jgi:hypothetical protein